MTRSTKWPKEKDLQKMRDVLSQGDATQIVDPKTLSSGDQVKYHICEQIIRYQNNNHLSQKALAKLLDENEALVSKVVRYRFQEFTIDRLMKFLTVLYPKAELKIKIAS